MVSLLESLLTLYSEIPRTDKDLRGFWFREITIYIKSQETNRDSLGGKSISNSNIAVLQRNQRCREWVGLQHPGVATEGRYMYRRKFTSPVCNWISHYSKYVTLNLEPYARDLKTTYVIIGFIWKNELNQKFSSTL